MPATSKSGGKNKKFGRHSRNPSSKLYPTRAERNARKRVARHQRNHPNWTPGNPTQTRPRSELPKQFIIFSGVAPAHKGDAWYACILDGRILSCGSYTEADSAKRESMDPRSYLIRREGSVMVRL